MSLTMRCNATSGMAGYLAGRNAACCLICAIAFTGSLALRHSMFRATNVRADSGARAVKAAAPQEQQTCVLPSSTLVSDLPGDLTVPFSDLFTDQCAVNQFAWQNFIALNWPVAAFDPNDFSKITRGLPDATKTIGGTGDNSTVWEAYQRNSYVFAVDSNGNLNPPAQGIQGWQTTAPTPAACGGAAQNKPVLMAINKAVGQPAGLEQAFSGPLIDQHGHYVRYEVLLNWDSFNFMVSNHLYDGNQQNVPIDFPVGTSQQPGTIMLKASWKVLSSAEASSGRFHTTLAFLYNPPIASADGKNNISSSCAGPVMMGLVGLHIAHKTAAFPQWIWATFEQVDNAPDRGNSASSSWSFFNANCPSCQLNTGPACPHNLGTGPNAVCDWQPTIEHTDSSLPAPTQVVRDTPISSDKPGPLINADAQQKLKQINPKSVWQFYELVDAQWPLKPCGNFAPCQAGQTSVQCKPFDFACAAAQPIPALLSNTTMETYFQSKSTTNPQSQGCCLGCHGAASATLQGNFADFTFELENASTPPKTPRFSLTAKPLK